MDRTTIEPPEKTHRNFSIVVPNSLYTNLKKITVPADTSLGAVCRELLEIVNHPLYLKLQAEARKKGVSVVKLSRQILEEGLKSK